MDAVVLLGWMKRDVATSFLREQCLFGEPLSVEAADNLWARHRRRTEQLGKRPLREPDQLTWTASEEELVARFLAEQSWLSGRVASIVKVDPRQLTVRQLGITLNRCDHFGRLCWNRAQWIEQWLNPAPTSMEGRVHATTNVVNIELPHPEFVLDFDPARGFQVVEAPRFVNLKRQGESTMLMAGHHRVYAYLSSAITEADPSILAVLSADRAGEMGSLNLMQGTDELYDRCPPIVSDFFDDRLAFHVKMRPRRFELQVRARMAAVPVECVHGNTETRKH